MQKAKTFRLATLHGGRLVSIGPRCSSSEECNAKAARFNWARRRRFAKEATHVAEFDGSKRVAATPLRGE